MRIDRTIRLLGAGALMAAAFALGGCSMSVADLSAAGAPAEASARPKEAGYLPVHDVPPERAQATMKPAEQARIEAELAAARDRQASTAAQAAAAK